ncbi:MAG: TatD family hydrolase [Chlamydiales bacterium]
MIIDSHAHLTSENVYEYIDEMLAKAKEAGIGSIINICTDAETLSKGLEIEKKYPWVRNAAATTPHDAATEGEAFFPLMAEQALKGNLVAVGETGLDYYYYQDTREVQQTLFKKYLHLALECQLPVIVHCRDAFEDFFSIVDMEYSLEKKGVLHCFTGTFEEAEELVKRGWYVSLSGIITFKRSEELRRVAQWIPLDHLLVETDTPYLAPQKYRGKTNQPAYIVETIQCIAEQKGISADEVIQATAQNARRLFNIL